MIVQEKLIEYIESLGYEIYRQGSMSDFKEYPDEYFTYWLNETNDEAFFDNKESRTVYNFDLNFYSTNPFKVANIFKEIKQDLKSLGFIVQGVGADIPSDIDKHIGAGITLLYPDYI